MKRSRIALTGLVCLLGIVNCSVNPVTGKKNLLVMSEQQEIALGADADPQIVATYGLYEDQKLQDFIDKKGNEMVAVSHRPDLKFQFRIMDSPVINAFAIPGGYVYFTRGILAHFNNEAEFAGVLGHEIGHVTARHSAIQQRNATVAQVLLIAGIVLSPTIREFANEAQELTSLLFLKFSRDNESQADELGVQYSTKIDYDSHNMANFFKTLNRVQQQSGASDIPTFLSTHPDPLDRYAKVEEETNKWQKKVNTPPYEVNRDNYLRMIDGIIYGEDPRQGYVDNNVFYHPELLFQFPTPANWSVSNMPSQVQMVPQDGKALLLFTLSGESTLQQAASKDAEQYQLTPVTSKSTSVNGLSALEVSSEQVNAQDPTQNLSVLSYYISYDNKIYVFHGVALKTDFDPYQTIFLNSMRQFRRLTDRRKIDVKPEHLAVRTVSRTNSLRNILTQYGIESKRLEEIAILNSMELDEEVPAGTLIKTVTK
ncbi:MAG: M48 family metalloprotease [Saprospiraceae bacterium]|nr:M48 family metalloprotease [Saprospiraceae bacterium]